MLESLALIWKRTRISNSRSAWRSNVRFRLFRLSHQTTVWTPSGGPSRRIVAEELRGRVGLLLAVAAAEAAEVVVRLAEVAEPLEVVDEQVDRRRRRPRRRALPALDLGGDLADRLGQVARR